MRVEVEQREDALEEPEPQWEEREAGEADGVVQVRRERGQLRQRETVMSGPPTPSRVCPPLCQLLTWSASSHNLYCWLLALLRVTMSHAVAALTGTTMTPEKMCHARSEFSTEAGTA